MACMMPNSIQPREYSMGGGMDGTQHIPQLGWQPHRSLPLLERQRVELELQLAG